ncbi:hypothetical protein [Aquipuribacter sp. MA13-6]|uniref:hypothetical protein n=1 Tax=unclassified Aquipuribacter TaxID=2635084 RepID=UPI003EEB515E
MALPLVVALVAVPVMAAAGLTQHLGWWSPWTAGPAALVGVALAVALVPRLPLPRLPWRTALPLLVLCAGFGLWAALTHGEHVVVRRDPGAYATYALALARFGGVPLDPGLDVFGLAADDPWVRVSAAAQYAVPGTGTGADGAATLSVVPQFLVGVPALLSTAWWVGGWGGLMVLPAVVAALALLAFSGLAAHLLGHVPALLAVLVLGLSQPVLLVARQTFSEPFSLLYVLTGTTLLVVATTTARRPRLTALVAGALLGANLFVRIDAVRELVLLVPLAAFLIGRRHPAGVPLLVGAALTGLPAALATTWWSSPYVSSVASSLGPLVVVGAVLAVLSVAGVVVGRRLEERWQGGAPAAARRAADLLPGLAAGLVAGVGLVLASRPLWLVDRRLDPYLPGMDDFVAALQSQQGLPVDGLRTYSEMSVQWLVWWLGPVTVVLASVAAVVLVHRGVRAALRPGPLPGWLLPTAVAVAVTVVSLHRPAITPDHPWADRRYVTVTYPFLVLAATAAITWLARGRRGPDGTTEGRPGALLRPVAAAALAVMVLVPTAAATLPLATTRTEIGQVDATEAVCTALEEAGPRPALLSVGFRGRVEWAPVVRARCGVPLVGIETPAAGSEQTLGDVLARAADAARTNGYTPAVMVGDQASAQLVADATGRTMPLVVDLSTTEPERLLEERPLTVRPLPVQAWVAPLA